MTKIAAVTQDRLSLSSHFGMAPEYCVYTVEDGQITGEETRLKPHHGQHPEHHEQHAHDGHGHADMFAPIADCQVLLCGGMGTPAYQKALQAGLEVVLTSGALPDVVQSYLQGRVISDLRRVHQH